MYKTRIWMQQVDTTMLSDDDPGTVLAKSAGLLPDRGTHLSLPPQQSYRPGPRLGSSLMTASAGQWNDSTRVGGGTSGSPLRTLGMGASLEWAQGFSSIGSLSPASSLSSPPSISSSGTTSPSGRGSGIGSLSNNSYAQLGSPTRQEQQMLQAGLNPFTAPPGMSQIQGLNQGQSPLLSAQSFLNTPLSPSLGYPLVRGGGLQITIPSASNAEEPALTMAFASPSSSSSYSNF